MEALFKVVPFLLFFSIGLFFAAAAAVVVGDVMTYEIWLLQRGTLNEFKIKRTKEKKTRE